MNTDAIDEEMLFAYVDGELDATQRARVEAAVARDPQLAALLAQQRRLKAQLGAHFAPVLDEVVPETLQRAAEAPASATVTDIAAARGARASRTTRRWALREWGAIAATLVLGLLVGMNLRQQNGAGPLAAGSEGVVAAGPLAAALTQQLAGPVRDAAGMRIGFSVLTSAGEYCRTFTLGDGQAGLACRRGERWNVDVLAAGAKPAAQGTLRQAATEMPDALRVAIEQRMTGDPLTADEEQAQIGRRWRAAGPH